MTQIQAIAFLLLQLVSRSSLASLSLISDPLPHTHHTCLLLLFTSIVSLIVITERSEALVTVCCPVTSLCCNCPFKVKAELGTLYSEYPMILFLFLLTQHPPDLLVVTRVSYSTL